GVLLYLTSATGNIGAGGVIKPLNSVINDIESGYLTPTATWIVMIVIAALAGAVIFSGACLSRTPGLDPPPVSDTLLKIGGIVIAAVVIAWVANINRGRLIV